MRFGRYTYDVILTFAYVGAFFYSMLVLGREQITDSEDCWEPELGKTQWMCRVSKVFTYFFVIIFVSLKTLEEVKFTLLRLE